MEEEIKTEWEAELLNSETTEDRVYSAEEVEAIKKKMQSDTEKWVQKLISKNKEYEKVLENVWKVAENSNYLIDLYEQDENIAKIILDKYYQWIDIEQYKESIWFEVDLTDPKEIQKHIDRKAQQKFENIKIDTEKKAFIKRLNMSKEEQDEFEQAFEERRLLKSFAKHDIETQFEKAYREISKDYWNKSMHEQEIIWKSSVIWNSKWWNNPLHGISKNINDEVSNFLKTYF